MNRIQIYALQIQRQKIKKIEQTSNRSWILPFIRFFLAKKEKTQKNENCKMPKTKGECNAVFFFIANVSKENGYTLYSM